MIVERNERRRVLSSALAAGALLFGATAHADEREQCAAAADQAQQLRDEGKYRRAREAMYSCARDVCPTPIKRDCLQWLDELDNLAPTVVFAAREAGRDLVDVKVSMDGVLVAERLDGKPVPVDLGEHTFKFEHGGRVLEQRAVIAAGQKLRNINVDFDGGAADPGAGPPGGADPGTAPADETERGSIAPALIVGGIGVVALGSFAVFGIQGKNAVDDLQRCRPRCAEEDVSRARTKLIIADISLAVGVVALGVATYMFLTRPKIDATTRTTGLPTFRFDAGPIAGGAAAGVGGTF
jgi:hypothetical protein